ncbi:MAG: FAD-dependent oxidoreductase [Anaerolineae bacterium]
MKREPRKMSQSSFDLLVIGGGIHGAFVALDAAQRGLTVALVERGDFGAATSANSLKTVHGGLRYLQDFDLSLVKKMIAERKTYLRIAPHLVHPLPFVVPTIKKLTRSHAAMRVALGLNDFFGRQRNQQQVAGKELPASHMLSKSEVLDYLPGLDPSEVTGGALWYDGQIYNTERFLMSVLKSAVESGATIANYIAAKKITTQFSKVTGIEAKDQLSGDVFHIKAKQVVNATGAWIDRLISNSNQALPNELDYPLTTAWNIVTTRFIDKCAAGLFGKKNKLLFVAPWRNYSVAGTVHETLKGSPEDFSLPIEKVSAFLDDINATYRSAGLTLNDVKSVHKGFHHVKSISTQPNKGIKALRRGVVYDHDTNDGLEGLITLVSVKFTTARAIAQEAVDIACSKAGLNDATCKTAITPIYGGDIADFSAFTRDSHGIDRSIVFNYGTEYKNLISGSTLEPKALLEKQVAHAVDHEMAFRLSDVLLRRTDIGSGEAPSAKMINICADQLAHELGWSSGQRQNEIDRFGLEMQKRWSFGNQSAVCLEKESIGY